MELSKVDVFSSFKVPEIQQIQASSAPIEPKKITTKKALIGAAAAAGVAAIAVGGILLHKSNSAKKIIEESKLLQQEGTEILEQAQKKFKEVTDLINEGAKNLFADVKDGDKVVRSFTTETLDGKLVPTVMQEFDEAGELLRETGIKDFLPRSIQEFNKKTGKFDAYVFNTFDDKYGLYTVSKGVRVLSNKKAQVSSQFYFDNGTLSAVKKGIQLSDDRLDKIAKIFYYNDDGALKSFTKNSKWENDINMVKGREYGVTEDGKFKKIKPDEFYDDFVDDFSDPDMMSSLGES